MQTNALYYGDCLDWMQKWDDNSVDLIYLDPPFNSKTNYNQLFHNDGGGGAQFRAFTDMWFWDEAAEDRLTLYENAAGRRAPDAIMGMKHVIGRCGMLAYLTYMAERLEHCYRLLKDTGGGRSKRYFSRKHDILFWYAKNQKGRCTFNVDAIRVPYKETSGYAKTGITAKSGKHYMPHPDGTSVDDVWDIPIINPMSKERLGYETQKPEALPERIIKASSNEGDIVLDPFCSCGTAAAVSKRLNRQFVGIEISSFAIDLIREKRLKDKSIPAYGIPQDLRSARKLAKENPFDFESWAVTRLPGFAPNTRQVADGGVDGRATITHKPDNWESKLALAQVKGGNFSLSGLRDFIHVTNRDNAALGCYVTLKPVTSPSARREIVKMGKVSIEQTYFPRMQTWSIKDYFDERHPRLPIMNDPYTGKPIQQLELF